MKNYKITDIRIRAITEEIIGILWCIVAILLYKSKLNYIMWLAVFFSTSSFITSVYFNYLDIKKEKPRGEINE